MQILKGNLRQSLPNYDLFTWQLSVTFPLKISKKMTQPNLQSSMKLMPKTFNYATFKRLCLIYTAIREELK